MKTLQLIHKKNDKNSREIFLFLHIHDDRFYGSLKGNRRKPNVRVVLTSFYLIQWPTTGINNNNSTEDGSDWWALIKFKHNPGDIFIYVHKYIHREEVAGDGMVEQKGRKSGQKIATILIRAHTHVNKSPGEIPSLFIHTKCHSNSIEANRFFSLLIHSRFNGNGISPCVFGRWGRHDMARGIAHIKLRYIHDHIHERGGDWESQMKTIREY